MGLNPVEDIGPNPDADTEVPDWAPGVASGVGCDPGADIEVPDEAPGVAAVVVAVSVIATESSGVARPLNIVLSWFSFLCSLSRFWF